MPSARTILAGIAALLQETRPSPAPVTWSLNEPSTVGSAVYDDVHC